PRSQAQPDGGTWASPRRHQNHLGTGWPARGLRGTQPRLYGAAFEPQWPRLRSADLPRRWQSLRARLPRPLLQWRALLRICTRLPLPPGILRLGVQSLARPGYLQLGLGPLPGVLWWLLHSGSRLPYGVFVAYRLPARGRPERSL